MKRCYISASKSRLEDWVLIELHGELESITGDFEDNLKIGDIRESNTKVCICFIVGEV